MHYYTIFLPISIYLCTSLNEAFILTLGLKYEKSEREWIVTVISA